MMQQHYPPTETSDRFFAALQEADRSVPHIPAEILTELCASWGNEGWPAKEELLAAIASHAWETQGTILECGCGLSTVLLALIARHNGRRVVSLEHIEDYAVSIRSTLRRFDLANVEILVSPLVAYQDYDWYELPEGTFREQEISLVVCDGPPEATRGCRHGVLPVTSPFLRHGAVILLDDVQAGGASVLARWKREFGLDAVIGGVVKPYGRIVIP
jgi:predicted O-methyltransferase YrrM